MNPGHSHTLQLIRNHFGIPTNPRVAGWLSWPLETQTWHGLQLNITVSKLLHFNIVDIEGDKNSNIHKHELSNPMFKPHLWSISTPSFRSISNSPFLSHFKIAPVAPLLKKPTGWAVRFPKISVWYRIPCSLSFYTATFRKDHSTETSSTFERYLLRRRKKSWSLLILLVISVTFETLDLSTLIRQLIRLITRLRTIGACTQVLPNEQASLCASGL